jgi:hypothetical protein
MIPVIPPLIKVMTVVLAGSLALSPVPHPEPAQAGVISKVTRKIVNTTTKTIIDNAKEKKKQDGNPNYKPKKKLPITAGFKPGRDPLPKETNPKQIYKNIWQTIKNDLGLK